MRSRCCNPSDKNYARYGGRGIEICQEWLATPSLFEDWSLENGYENDLTIDRIEVDLGYTPDNCRWVRFEENAKYKSTTRLLEVDGVTHTGRDWSDVCGLGKHRINKYLRNYSTEEVQGFISYCLHNGLPERTANTSYMDTYLYTQEFK